MIAPRPLLIACGLGAIVLLGSPFTARADVLQIENASLRVSVDPAKGTFSVQSLPTGKIFVPKGKLSASNGTGRKLDRSDKTFGPGSGIELTFPDGNHDELDVFPNVPFVLIHSTLHNAGQQDQRITSLQPFAMSVDIGKSPADLRALSTAGLTTPGKTSGGYEWIALADPATRAGVVAGWVTDDRAGGVMLCSADENHVTLQPQLDYGRLRIASGADARTETLAVGYFDDARLGLEAWADQIARIYNIHLHPKPVGYCTWYSDKHGGSSDEKSLAELAETAAKELKPFGFSLIQIDDGWQEGIKDNGPRKVFSAYRPDGPYPSGMKAMADDISAQGLMPGIWFMPFAATWNDPFFKDHQDWLVKTEDGKPFVTSWGGTSLDMTQPGAREYLRTEAARIGKEWGYRYFKMDGLYTGVGVKQIYVNSGYRPDGIGNAVFSNPDVTNIEAYRDGLKIVRAAAGDDVFLLGCCAPQNMRSYGGAFGLLDAMRVGPDNGPDWKALLRGPTFASRSYFLNGRVWHNDPDPIYVRAKVPLNHARLICSWVTIAGDLSLCSDWLPGLPADRMDLLKRTMPSHNLPARPVDLFENDPPRIWLLTDSRADPARNIIGLYNWTSEPLQIDEPPDRVGLPASGAYVGFDYWANEFIPPFETRLKATLPPESCQVLSVRPAADHPQLISTSRHITQGIVDVIEEKWDPAAQTLSGISSVVAGDPYELRIALPAGGEFDIAPSCEVAAADAAAGVSISPMPSSRGLRVSITSPVNRDVSWSVKFPK